MSTHRAVAEAFIDNPHNFPQVNHKDENPRNNQVDNLEWCTAKYNMNYGQGAKTRHLKIDYSTEKRKVAARANGIATSKPVKQFDKKGNYMRTFRSRKEASRHTGVNASHIGEVISNKRNSAGGFLWRATKGGVL